MLPNAGIGSHGKHQKQKKKDHKFNHGQHSKENVKKHHHRDKNGMKNVEHYHKHQQHSNKEKRCHKNLHHSSEHKGHNREEETEIHCKCWPEKVSHHTSAHEIWEKGQHHKQQNKGGHDRQHQGHHSKEHHEVQEANHKAQHEGHYSKEHHEVQEHHHKAQHEGHQSKEQHEEHHRDQHESWKKGHQHKHNEGEENRQQNDKHGKENQGEHEKHKHKHKQGEAKKHHTAHHEVKEDHDKAQHEDHQSKEHHEVQEHHHQDQHEGHQSKEQHEEHHRDQHESWKMGHQHKHNKGEEDRQNNDKHGKENQGEHEKHKQGEAKIHHTTHREVKEDHHKAQHEGHYSKEHHEVQEHHDQAQHKGHHSKEQHEEHHKDQHENWKKVHQHKHKESKEDRQHNDKHGEENQGEYEKHKHKQGEAKEHHIAHHEVQEEHHQAQHESHQNKNYSKETKRNCKCWRKRKESGHQQKEEQKDRHHKTKCHQEKQNEKECKFLSSESSSSHSSNKSCGKPMEKSTKAQRRQEKSSTQRHHLSHQEQHKGSKKYDKDFKKHHKASSHKFAQNNLNDTRTSESQEDSWISSDFLEFFEGQNLNSKFEPTSTLMHDRNRKDSSEENTSPFKQNLSGRLSWDLVLLVKALMSDGQHKGYQTTAYLDKSHTQVQTVSLDQKSLWKTCFDASVSGYHKASARIRWGKNCQDYQMAAQASTGQMAGAPAVQLLWQWKTLPSWLKRLTGSIMPFVPGVAYTLGFSELHRHNTPHQFTVRMATTSTDTFETILKTPEMTIYKQGIPFPLDLTLNTEWLKKFHLMEVTALPDVTSLIKSTDKAVCKVDAEKIQTFDQMILGCSLLPAPCYTLIAQDCSNQLRFLVAMKKMGQGFSTFEINVKLGSSDIKIHCDTSEEFRIQLNGMWLLLKNDTYINEKDCIRIHKNATTVTVKAPKNGLEQISFNGQSVQVQISPLMRGKTCGLCGNADRSLKNGFRKPNHEMAKTCNGLVHSWTVADNTCQSGCAMTRRYMMLEDQLLDERQSTCYSVEPVLTCREGCRPIATTPIPVAFHCLPKESAIDLADWQSNPRQSSEDLIKDVDIHTSCACTEECSATQ
uniref:VWFD domain-containing protein n=1 Tax=Pyxicephalus adspersus TaxID=30357 RepID=A0AAV2ZTE9_PYXAD|nr:TPA: hypothetical protein GDO54_016182 [Pyxicephalus adspersus]